MNLQPISRIQFTVSSIVQMLVREDYVGLERLSNHVRLSATQIESGIVEYGKTLVLPPEGAYNNLDLVEVSKQVWPTYSLRFRLFTKEEGRSDLELQATLIDDGNTSSLLRIEIDGILVA